MADIQLTRPAAGNTQTIPSAPDGRYVFNFPADAATLSKNGDSLVLTFEDGGAIEVQDFYKSHNAEQMPSFQVDGAEIAGEDFFAALDDELSPAAGPGARPTAQSGRYNEWGNSSLMDGIDHLGPDDLGFDFSVELHETEATGRRGDEDDGWDASLSASTAAGPEPGPTPMPEPEPDPTLEANDDLQAAAILNRVNVQNFIDLANDNTGSVAATEVVGSSPRNSDLPTGVTVIAPDGNGTGLTLQLDGDAMLDRNSGLLSQIPNERYTHVADRVVNYAEKLKPLDGEYSVEYTAQDDSGELTDTATATFRLGDNTGGMSGGSGSDVAWMRDNSGTVATGAGNDVILAMTNRTGGVIDGGAGNDSIVIGSTEAGSTVSGGSGADWINVSGTNEGVILGGEGGGRNPVPYRINEGGVNYDGNLVTVYENAGEIYGGGSADILDVVEGSDNDAYGNATNSIFGGAGNDRLVLRGGSSYMDGGEGNDHVQAQGDDDDFSGEGHYWADGRDQTDTDVWNAVVDRARANDANHATLKGGAGNDELKASDAAHHNVLYGDDDVNSGIVGNDRIRVQDYAEHNTVFAGGGNDRIEITNWAAHNKVYGEGGNDSLELNGLAHHNLLDGGEGNDTLKILGDSAAPAEVKGRAYYVAHEDELQGNANNNTLDGGAGNDYLDGWAARGGNTFLGGSGSDTLYGGAGNDYLDGGADTDVDWVYGGAGNDIIVDRPNDDIRGEGGIDFLLVQGDGGVKARSVSGMEVTIRGGAALDLTSLDKMAGDYGILVSGNKLVLDGDKWAKAGGNCTSTKADLTLTASIAVELSSEYGALYGSGNHAFHTLDNASGEVFNGSAGDDTFSAAGTAVRNVIDGGDGDDRIVMEKGEADTISGGYGDDHVEMTQGNANDISGGGGDDRIFMEMGEANAISGGDGDDSIEMGHGNANAIDGGAGNDRIVMKGETNTISGGAGNDDIAVDGRYNAIDGGDGNDRIVMEGEANTISGGAGNDDIAVNGRYNAIDGGEGNDIISLSNSNNTVDGGAGIDFLLSENMTMDDLLGSGTVNNMEVFIRGADALSLTGIRQLADDYGITLKDADNDGNAESMTLDMTLWNKQADGSFHFTGEVNGKTPDLTLQVNSGTMQEQDGGEAQQAVFILNSGG